MSCEWQATQLSHVLCVCLSAGSASDSFRSCGGSGNCLPGLRALCSVPMPVIVIVCVSLSLCPWEPWPPHLMFICSLLCWLLRLLSLNIVSPWESCNRSDLGLLPISPGVLLFPDSQALPLSVVWLWFVPDYFPAWLASEAVFFRCLAISLWCLQLTTAAWGQHLCFALQWCPLVLSFCVLVMLCQRHGMVPVFSDNSVCVQQPESSWLPGRFMFFIRCGGPSLFWIRLGFVPCCRSQWSHLIAALPQLHHSRVTLIPAMSPS